MATKADIFMPTLRPLPAQISSSTDEAPPPAYTSTDRSLLVFAAREIDQLKAQVVEERKSAEAFRDQLERTDYRSNLYLVYSLLYALYNTGFLLYTFCY